MFYHAAGIPTIMTTTTNMAGEAKEVGLRKLYEPPGGEVEVPAD